MADETMNMMVAGMPAAAPGTTPLSRSNAPAVPSLGDIRRLRSIVQAMDASFTEIAHGEATIAERSALIESRATRAKAIVAALSAAPYARENGDVLQDIENAWEELARNSIVAHPTHTMAAPELLRQLGFARRNAHTLIYLLGRLTIPARLNDWLATMRPGNRISFHRVFADEVPDAATRQRLLEDFADTPRILPQGLIDRVTGVVYRYSSSRGWQWASAALLAVLFFLPPLAIFLGCHYSVYSPLAPSHTRTLMGSWVMLVIGVAAHAAVDWIKQNQSATKDGLAPPGIQMTELLPRLNARIGDLMLRLASMMLAYVTFVYFRGVDQFDATSALLAGFGSDSIVGVAIGRLARVDAVKTALRLPQTSTPKLDG